MSLHVVVLKGGLSKERVITEAVGLWPERPEKIRSAGIKGETI